MMDCQQASMPCTLYSRIPASVHDISSLMGKNQAMSNAKQKAGFMGNFSWPSPYLASLCEQLLAGGSGETPAYPLLGLEDCRIYTSSYPWTVGQSAEQIGRLPYYYFLLLSRHVPSGILDWKTAVLLLPSTPDQRPHVELRLEDCRIITSFYCSRTRKRRVSIGRLPYYYFLLL